MPVSFETFCWNQEVWPQEKDIIEDYTLYVKNALDFYLTCGVAVESDTLTDTLKARRELTKMYMVYHSNANMIDRALNAVGDFYLLLDESNVIVETKDKFTYIGVKDEKGKLSRTFICDCHVVDAISFYRVYTLMRSMNISCRPEILKDVEMTDYEEILEDDSWKGTMVNYFK
jgi:hypothetical protein